MYYDSSRVHGNWLRQLQPAAHTRSTARRTTPAAGLPPRFLLNEAHLLPLP